MNDGLLNLDDNSMKFIDYCYNRILVRDPHIDGKERYVKLLNKTVSKMDDKPEKFLDYCYNWILGRNPDSAGNEYWIGLLNEGMSKYDIIISFLNSKEYSERRKLFMNPTITFAPPGHFYSPLPDVEKIQALYQKVDKFKYPVGININESKQIELLKHFQKYVSILPFGDGFKKNNTRYFFNGNEWYSYGDAIVLFCMINYFTPKCLIEVGSGYSSLVSLDTCELLNLNTKITFIEPFPDLILKLLSDKDGPEKILLKNDVQTVDPSLFDNMNRGDILFIDCSHVVKFSSDVLFIITEILPRLKPGVIIHFHDIFWPFEYPLDWLERGLAWNEAYFIKVFLINNKNYEILYFNDYMGQMHQDLVKKYMPLAMKNFGCGLWLEKVS